MSCKRKVVAHQNGDHAGDELGPDVDCPCCTGSGCIKGESRCEGCPDAA